MNDAKHFALVQALNVLRHINSADDDRDFLIKHEVDEMDAAIAAVEAALAELVAPTGWRLVPVKPTAAMCDAGRWIEYPESGARMTPVDDDAVCGVWAAMLAAAPAPVAQPTDAEIDEATKRHYLAGHSVSREYRISVARAVLALRGAA